MSATVVSAGSLLAELGWEDEYENVGLASGFDKENRKVVVRPVASMGNKQAEVSYPKAVRALVDVVGKHKDERVLVHTVSYRLGGVLFAGLTGRTPSNSAYWSKVRVQGKEQSDDRWVITYTDSRGRDDALAFYLQHMNAVLIASSMDRGVDLPGEACRVQVIAKVPFPNLGDKQVSTRLYSTKLGQVWYTVQTVRSLVQMCGRGVRSKDDWCVTYVLDSQFGVLFSRNRHLFPEWWKEGLVWR